MSLLMITIHHKQVRNNKHICWSSLTKSSTRRRSRTPLNTTSISLGFHSMPSSIGLWEQAMENAFFLNKDVNEQLEEISNVWIIFTQSSAIRNVPVNRENAWFESKRCQTTEAL